MLNENGQDAGFIAIVSIPVDGPERQQELIDLLVGDVEEWVRHCAGFLSANYHASIDGKFVLNYAQWQDEQSYRDSFRNNPRSGMLREQIVRLSNGAGPTMVGYTLRHSVTASRR